jgi:hypothetical protein
MQAVATHDCEGQVDGVPAFRCRILSTGSWSFRCTCGQEHVHGACSGHRVAHCQQHQPHGYVLLDPVPAHRLPTHH